MKVPSLIGLINAACFLVLLPAPSHALTPAQVFEKVKDAVVVVKTLDAQGKVKAQGSGVILSPGRVATNCHVVEGGTSYRVGRGRQLIPATLYAEDGDKDVCLLDAKGIQGKPVQLGRAVGLKVGDPVYAVGAPKGLELSLSDGIVAQLRGGPAPMIQTTAAISPGSSGGGLFDGEGRLVGLTTFYLEGGQSLNFAMPAEWISEVKPRPIAAAEGRSHAEWLKRAIALDTTKDYQGLLDWCQEWTKSDPKYASAWYELGCAYDNLARHDEAIEAYRQSIRIDPKYASAWNGLGNAYDTLARYDEAIEVFRQAIGINPEDTSAWSLLGLTYDTLARYDEAIEVFRQAIGINPEDTSAWSLLGLTYDTLARYDEAIEVFRQAVRIDPGDAVHWYELGRAYGHVRRHKDAIEAYRQSIRIKPKVAYVWYDLGVAYSLSGNKTAALYAVRELRRLDPALADKLFNLIVPR